MYVARRMLDWSSQPETEVSSSALPLAQEHVPSSDVLLAVKAMGFANRRGLLLEIAKRTAGGPSDSQALVMRAGNELNVARRFPLVDFWTALGRLFLR